MGKLADRAKARSPYIRLAIGEKTQPMKYKSWKEIVNSYGDPSFRYSFEVETSEGFVVKTFDNNSEAFAQVMDKVPFNAFVVIIRQPKLDKFGNLITNKSIYKVTLVGRTEKVSSLEEVPEKVQEIEGEQHKEESLPSEENVDGQDERPGWAEEILGEEE